MRTLILATALMLGTSVSAATLASETNARGGDYPDSPASDNPNINRTVGNAFRPTPDGDVVLTGSLRLTCDANSACTGNTGLQDPGDAFFFEVAPDQEVTDITLSFEADTLALPGVTALSFDLVIDDDITTLGNVFGTRFFGAPNLVPIGTTPDPLGAGAYNLFLGNFAAGSIAFTGQVNWRFNATYSSTAAPVPLPATAPILLAALGAFGLMRRKQR